MNLSSETLKLEIINLNPVAIKVYQYILAEERLYLDRQKELNTNSILINLSELLEIVENNYKKFDNSTLFQDFLPIFHHTIQLTDIESATTTIILFFNQLYANIQKDGNDTVVILQFVQQFLHSISISSAKIDDIRKILNENKIKFINVFSDQKTIRLQSLLCVEILVNKFNQVEILDEIWSERLISSYFDEIFSHLINIYINNKKIYKNEEFWILSLIYLHKNRKFAIYWLHKAIETIVSQGDSLLHFEINKYFKWDNKHLEIIHSSWLTYLTILENLEGKQSHLILPSLLMLEKIEIPCLWKEFLTCNMLKHTNTLVLKWSVNYVLTNFTTADFIEYSIFLNKFIKNNSCNDALEIIMNGFNNTFLYAKQSNNDIITSDNYQTFLKASFNRFFKIFVNIDWKSIPMHIIMISISYLTEEIKNITFELLLKLTTKIRRIENKSIRLSIRELFFQTFQKTIERLNLNDLFKLFDTIFNQNEILSEYEKYEILNHISKRNDNEIAIISVDLLKILFNCNFPYHINLKILNIFLNNNSDCETMLKCLTIESDTGNNLVTILKEKFENLNDLNTKEKEFIFFFINLYDNNNFGCNFSKELNLIINNFNGIGKGKIVKFSILKECFVDRLLERDFPEKQRFIIDNVSMLLDKGGHKTLYCIVNEFAMILEKCERNKVVTLKMSSEILNRIILEIKNYIKIFGYEMIDKTVRRLVYYLINLSTEEFYENIIKLLDVDTTNIDLYYHIYDLLCFGRAFRGKEESFYTSIDLEGFFERSYPIMKELYNSENGIKLLAKGLLFGEPLLGEQRVEYDYIVENNLKFNQPTSIAVRLASLNLLFTINYQYCQYDNMKDFQDETTKLNMKDFRDYLLNESEKLNNKKSRYFKDSKQHRLKLRIIQSIGAICSMERSWDDRFLIPILNENNQNDVTSIIQLIIAYTLESESILIYLLENASKYSHSALVSIFIIVFLYSRRLTENNLGSKEIVKKFINLILPWTLGQNFNVRLQGQITIYHLIENFELKNDFQYLFNAIAESFKQGNPTENFKKLNDFRYSKKFRLKEYLEFYTIVTLIPKLTNLALDEWFIDFSKLKDYQNDNDKQLCYYLTQCKIKDDYLKKYYDEAIHRESDVIEEIIQNENIQRKINPIVYNDNNNVVFCHDLLEEKKDRDMIVIASLVDKLPNLGGICRTCEVLGIKNVYLSTLKYTETKEFKGLSMTAEKWLNLNELKPQKIQEFLVAKKIEGYKIIGAEQTSNSINFIDFKFPPKSILLLGHEKEGIPSNLIAFVDYIVEIPQFGVVRSLNVHVTAALFLWEYCKQHLSI